MDRFPICKLKVEDFPPLLREIPQPPKQLYIRGKVPSPEIPLLSVVGSRRYTTYGAQVVSHLIGGLRGSHVGIVSGMAIGIDGLAHEAALDAGLYTMAIPGSGLGAKVIYPARHRKLAERILTEGGTLMSEYEENETAQTWTFPQRNRIVTGVSQAVLLIEASEKSGTLITARMAADYNRELLVVPGNIFSENSKGVHQFLKLGATPVTSAADIIDVMNLDRLALVAKEEQTDPLLKYLEEPRQLDEIVRETKLPTHTITARLMELELLGQIEEKENLYRTII